ncbi:hypothetical protein CKO28_12300 [Rhodovibrio sodomensis]|uniref:Tat pathway signal sequence domain protein n=1 Tax=Rhodovibrio sodomensis TaxID=1088 RepID=A0ABS1DFU0_9PROT|nr:Tat pathway signal sequence domain protein [Rhodovibrio sodomensis]MBK1668812.1 hypothetical protein [Rhodovibrio sodomensis]
MNKLAVAGLALAGLALAGAARAQDDGIRVELNKLEPVGAACRAYLVFENRTGTAFDPFKLDPVMFDTDGVIAKRVAVAAGPLPAGKTSVKLFDIDGVSCGGIRRVLLNSVMACDTGGDSQPDCTAMTAPSSRTEATFIK